MNKISCCRECVPPKRYPGCHDHCEEYQKQKAELEERRKARNSEEAKASDIRDYIVKRRAKSKMKYRK